MRSSARRSVAASTWLRAEMPNTMWSQRQMPRSSIAASETFGYLAQQDVVVGSLADEGLVVVEVLAGGPQAQGE